MTSTAHVTAAKAAEILGVSYQTVILMLQRGDIAGRKIGRRWYVPIEDGLPRAKK